MFKIVGFAVPRSGYGFTGAGASVLITDALTGAAATLYNDTESATVANPLTADSTGKYEAKVADGVYNIVVTYAGGGTTTINLIRCFDPQALLTNVSGVTVTKGTLVAPYTLGTNSFKSLSTNIAGATPTSRLSQSEALRSVGIVVSPTIADSAKGYVSYTRGTRVDGVGSGWTPGKTVYGLVDNTMTQTRPTSGTFCVVGYAINATDLLFSPQDPSSGPSDMTDLCSDRNILINGGFDIWQRNTSFSVIAAGTVHADRWRYGKVGGQIHTVSRTTATVPTDVQAGFGQRAALSLVAIAGNGSPAAGDSCTVYQIIEGTRFRSIHKDQPCTVSFWVRASKTGNFSVTLQTAFAAYSCVRRVAISAANTWEFKTVTFPAAGSTAGAGMTTDETASVTLILSLMTGTTAQTATANDGTWIAGNFWGQTGDTNFCAAGADDMFFANVQLERGNDFTSYEYRPFAQELTLCQRYYWKTFPYATPVAQNSGVQNGSITYRPVIAGVSSGNSVHVRFPVSMRVAPSVVSYNPNAANINWRNFTDGADSGGPVTVGSVSADAITLGNVQAAGDAVGETVGIHITAEAEL